MPKTLTLLPEQHTQLAKSAQLLLGMANEAHRRGDVALGSACTRTALRLDRILNLVEMRP